MKEHSRRKSLNTHEARLRSELLEYVEIIKTILDRSYGKEVVFYEDGRWYSRDHCRYISIDELAEYIYDVTKRSSAY